MGKSVILVLFLFFYGTCFPGKACGLDSVFLFGDSITAGPYSSFLKMKLSGRYKVMVFAKVGDSSSAIRGTVESVLRLDSIQLPKYVVVYSGVNNCVNGAGDNWGRRVVSNLNGIYGIVHGLKIRMIVMKIHVPSACSIFVNGWLDNFSRKKEVSVIDTMFMDPWKVHPVRSDAKKLADKVANEIRRMETK